MRENLDASYGLVFSEAVLLALVEAGLERDDAYRLVQHAATRTWEERRPFRDVLADDNGDHRAPRRRASRPVLRPRTERSHTRRAPSTRSTKRPHRESRRAAPSLHRARSASSTRSATTACCVVASDRISVFDVVLGDTIPDKGRVLTALSTFWFERHRSDRAEPPRVLRSHRLPRDRRCRRRGPGDARARRAPGAARVRRARLPVRLGVEGLRADRLGAGPGAPGRACAQAERLPAPIFTPTTKPEAGHDLPLSDSEAAALVGDERFEQLRDLTLQVYEFGAELALKRGLILADTKLEFGTVDDELLVIDEMLTPDSSRYWPAEDYRVGVSPPSFDKQYVRDHYLSHRLEPRAPGARAPARRSSTPRARSTSRPTSWSPAPASTSGTEGRHRMSTFEARIDVTHLPGVLDPQGATVARALPALGYHNVGEVSHREDDPAAHRRADGRRRARSGRRDVPATARQPRHRAIHDRDHGAVSGMSRASRGRPVSGNELRARRGVGRRSARRRGGDALACRRHACAASTRWWCPAASRTATICAPARSRGSRRS